MKILFVLGFPNPFPGASWTRIGFFAEDRSKKGHAVEVLGAFSYKPFRKRASESPVYKFLVLSLICSN